MLERSDVEKAKQAGRAMGNDWCDFMRTHELRTMMFRTHWPANDLGDISVGAIVEALADAGLEVASHSAGLVGHVPESGCEVLLATFLVRVKAS